MRTVAAAVFCVSVFASSAFAQLPSPLLTCTGFPSDPDILMVCYGSIVPRPKVVSFGEASIGLSASGQDAQVWLRLTSTAEFDQGGITYTIYPEGQMPVTRTLTLYVPDHGPSTIGIPLHDDDALVGQHLAFAVEVVFPKGRGMAGLTMRDTHGFATMVPAESTRR
jgi:hypothetical protein